MRNLLHISIHIIVIIMTACGSKAPNRGDEAAPDNIIASVNQEVLTTDRLMLDMPAGLVGTDSVTFARMYIDNWVLTQLKIDHAKEVLSNYESNIERLVEDYRRSLIIRNLDQYYVDHAIDLDISDQQILAHYRANSASFRLDHTLVEGVVVRTPENFRNTATLKTALESAKSGDSSEILALCEKHDLYIIDLSKSWVSYDDFLSNLPTERSRSYDNLLQKSGAQQMSGDDMTYHFIITNTARKGSIAPIEYVEDDIRHMLYSERRADIVKQYENELRQSAMSEGCVEICDSVLRNSALYTPTPPSPAEELEIREIDEMEEAAKMRQKGLATQEFNDKHSDNESHELL